jgi:hypothetical protein
MSRVLPDMSRKMLDLVDVFERKDSGAISDRVTEVYRDLQATHAYYGTLLQAIDDQLEAGAKFADVAKPVIDARFERELLRAVVGAVAGVLRILSIDQTYQRLFGYASRYMQFASVAVFFHGDTDGPFDRQMVAMFMEHHCDHRSSSEVLHRLVEAAWREPFGHDQESERRRIIAQSRRALFQLEYHWAFVVQAYSDLNPSPVP